MRSGSLSNPLSFRKLGLVGLAATTLVGACGLDERKAEVTKPRCVDRVEPLASLDAMTPLGVSAQSILNYASGVRTDAMHWRQETLSEPISFGLQPESGVTQIITEVLPTNTPARWIVSTPEAPRGGPVDIMDCPDRLELDVQLRVESSGGALRELAPTTLVATSPYAANIRYVTGGKHPRQGSLALVNTKPDGVVLRNLSYNLSYTPYAHYAEIRGLVARGEAVAQVELGTWPEKAPALSPRLVHNCLSPVEQFFLPHSESVMGFRADAIQARIASANPLLISPSVGEKVSGSVNFAVTQDRSCISSIHEFPNPAERNQFGTSGLLEFNVGPRKTRIPAIAVSNTDGQAITSITVKSEWSSKRPMRGALPADAFKATYGDFGLNLTHHKFFAVYGQAQYRQVLPGSGKPAIVGGFQVLGIIPNPRLANGALVELLGRWEFSG